MKILVILFLCSCALGVPLGEQEEALAELIKKVLEADPEENDIIIEDPIKEDISTAEQNAVGNATELPSDKADTTTKTKGEPIQEKPTTIIGEIILDPTPDGDTPEDELVTEFIEQAVTERDLNTDTLPLTGTLIIDTITEDDDKTNDESEGPSDTDDLEISPADEAKRDPSEYDELDTPIRIPLNNENLQRNWVSPFPNRFNLFKPRNKDYDDHLTMLENPFLSPLDTLPMDQTFFESTTNADYDVPSQDYPMYDDVYDDEQAPKNMNNESNSLEPLPNENDVVQVLDDDNDPNEQTDLEESTMIPLEENPDKDLPSAPDADTVNNSEADNTMPLNQDDTTDNVKGDYDYSDDQVQNYPVETNPDFERNYFSYNMDNNMERKPDFIRYNTRSPFHSHYYDSYDKYINIGDIKNFNPYVFYPKRHVGYDLFFRPSYDMENRDKMTPLAPSIVMEPPRDTEIKNDNDNMNNIGTIIEEVGTNVDNTYDYVDNENVESIDEPKENSFAEQDTPQDVYNEYYDNRPKWNHHHSVLNSDFSPMAEALPIQRNRPVMEIPRYYDNDLSYYRDKYDDNNRDMSMYLFNRLIRNLGDDSRFKQFREYKNNPYYRNDAPIIVFVGPPRNQNDETEDTNQVASESENQYINSEGTLLTDIKHNVDVPYSPGYHPAFYTNYHLYGNENSDNSIEDDGSFTRTQSYNQVDVPLRNQRYEDIIESYPYQQDDFGYHRKYPKRDLYRNRDYTYQDYDNLYKPNRYYYRREPRTFMDDNLYF